jgi:hypothetical protein
MKNVQIRAQFRFNDGDVSKKPYKWEVIPMTDEGEIEDSTYEPKCLATGAQKAVDYLTVSIPTTAEELGEIPEEVTIELVGEAYLTRAKKKQADSLRESYESPTQAANREKREAAARREYLGEKMLSFTEANPGEMPTADLFATWTAEAEAEAKK